MEKTYKVIQSMKDGEKAERFSLHVYKDGILCNGISEFKKNSNK